MDLPHRCASPEGYFRPTCVHRGARTSIRWVSPAAAALLVPSIPLVGSSGFVWDPIITVTQKTGFEAALETVPGTP